MKRTVGRKSPEKEAPRTKLLRPDGSVSWRGRGPGGHDGVTGDDDTGGAGGGQSLSVVWTVSSEGQRNVSASASTQMKCRQAVHAADASFWLIREPLPSAGGGSLSVSFGNYHLETSPLRLFSERGLAECGLRVRRDLGLDG